MSSKSSDSDTRTATITTLYPAFMSSDSTNSSSDQISSTRGMSTSSEPSVLQSLLKDAIDKYKIQVGTSLIENQLATQLGTCDDVQSVAALLEERVQAFRDFLGHDRHPKMKQSIRRTVHVLHTIFTGLGGAVQVGHGIVSIPFPPVKLIFAAIGILLATVKDVRASYDALLHLFESIGNFVHRLDIYTKIPPTTVMTEIVVKIMVELLSTLGLATKQIKQGALKKFGMKLLGENEVEAALQRLDRLTDDEARATAAQTLEVVYRLVQNMGLVMDNGKASNDGVRQVLELMQDMTSQANKEKRDQMRRDLRGWLSPPDPWKNHNIARDIHHDGTATWFIESDTFAEWKSSGYLLWIRGKPGAGKTVLCSTIIDNIEGLRKSGLASLAFFYCDFRDDGKKDRRGLLSSLLFQLCYQSDSYCKILSDFYSEHGDGSQDPSDGARTQCLKDVLKCPGQAPIYIIIDALDECPKASDGRSSRKNVLRLVEELVGLHLTNLRIYVTSRPEADIESVLKHLTPRSVSLHSESGQKQDIIDYVTSVVKTDPGMKRWNAADKELVIETLSQRANGMFRWVSCQVDYLRPCLPACVRRALDELPETLDGTYERILEDIDKANWEYAHRIFQFLTVASRPLTVEELAEILAFDFEAGDIPKLVTNWRSEDPDEALLSTCRSLIAVVDGGYNLRVVEFSHFSVKEFLTSSRLATGRPIISRYHVLMTPAHTIVAQACLGALLYLDENVSEDTLNDFPLVQYAAEKWVDHAQFDSVSLSMQDGIKLLFDPNKPYLTVWLWIFDPEASNRRRRPIRPLKPRGTPLHYAALYGMCDVARFLVGERSQRVNARRPSDNRTPLFLAAERGYPDVTRALLDYGANKNARDRDGMTPLHRASHRGHLEVVQMLLNHGADASARDNYYQTPLHVLWREEYSYLSLFGRRNRDYGKVAELLLEWGTDPNAQDNHNETALHLVSKDGHINVAEMLLDRGADVNARNNDNTVPLHFASQGGHLNIVRMLLDRGADVNARDKNYKTPLHWMLQGVWFTLSREQQGDLSTVAEILLESGADANARDNDDNTPLHLASKTGHVKVAEILLDRGADANARQNDENTPLHLASENGHVEVAKILLDRGVDSNARNHDDTIPLHFASQRGHLEIVQMLLTRGADVNARDKNYSTPLRHVLRHVWPSRLFTQPSELQGDPWNIAELLLESGADANVRDNNDDTLLHLAIKNGSVKFVESLLDRGADANARDNDDNTPLHLASRNGHVEFAKILLDRGVDANARNNNNTTPLHYALQQECLETVQILLDRGADVNARDKNYQTPLHCVLQPVWFTLPREKEIYPLKVTELLLELGADANARDNDDNTPLHLASKTGRVKVSKILLDRGADANARNNNNTTPLHVASQRGHVEIVRILLNRDADVNARDKNYKTPLHCVVQDVSFQPPREYLFTVAELLLESGADANSRDNDDNTPLHLAIKSGSVKIAEILLDRGADANARENGDNTPLHLASKSGHVEVAKILFDRRVDANVRNNDNTTPLHFALKGGHLHIVRMLLDRGADVDARDKNYNTPLHCVFRGVWFTWSGEQQGDLFSVAELLKLGADANARDNDDNTSLHLASKNGHVEVAEILLDRGADANARDNDDNTPLHLASKNGHVKVAGLLLDRGVDANSRKNDSNIPLHFASQCGHLEIVRMLLGRGADINARDKNYKTPLHCLPQDARFQQSREKQGDLLNVAEILLESGADPNARDNDDNTPLHLASKNGHVEVADILLDHGADANSRNNDNTIPLHFASQGGHLEIVQMLLDRRADVNARDKNYKTSLHCVLQDVSFVMSIELREDPWNVAELLLESGADANARDNDDNTPLHLAIKTGSVKIAESLLDQGADVNARDNDGNTPLHIASKNGHVKVAEILLDHGADANARADDDNTSLHLASKNGHVKLVEILLDRGVDANAQNNDNTTSLHLASEAGHLEVVRLLLRCRADVNACDNEHHKPFYLAWKRGHRRVIQALLEQRAIEEPVPGPGAVCHAPIQRRRMTL